MEKIAFTFWDGPQLSLLNIISILSFTKLNPSIHLIIYTLEGNTDANVSWKTDEHSNDILNQYSLELLKTESNLSIVKINPKDIAQIASSIQIADFVRIQKLFEHGGIWIDSDILFYKEIPGWIWDATKSPGFVISYFNTITTGFLGLPKASIAAELALKEAFLIQENNQFHKNYQSFGPDLWKNIFLKYPKELINIHFLSDTVIYPIIWLDLDKFYYQKRIDLLKENTIGIHWYNGSPTSRSFINNNLEYFLSNGHEQTTFQVCMKMLDQKTNILASVRKIMAKQYQIAA